MNFSTIPVLCTARRQPLATCCAALFAFATADACAGIVTSCNDDGNSGTLRSVIAAAADGDTIDMTPLHCSYISLHTGAIVVPQNNLTIQGPGNTAFPVSSNQSPSPDTIFYHAGTGTLVIEDLYLAHGAGHHTYHADLSPRGVYGGCIFSNGSVDLVRSRVYHCQAYSTAARVEEGGAVFTYKNLILTNSTISSNIVDANSALQNPILWGGGAYVGGNLTAKYSTIENNTAGFANYGHGAYGGGVFVNGNASISNSTIAYNFSRYQAGGMLVLGVSASPSATISDSTIAKNKAPRVAGILSFVPTTINNSTIASNQNLAATGLGAGITFAASFAPIAVDLHSTLIADNAFDDSHSRTNDDIAVINGSATNIVTFATDAQQGNFNLIRALDPSVSAASLPPDTQIGVCPLLGPLRDNGGPTWTMALYSGSPAINAGVNNTGLAYDQRGGPMPVPDTIPPPPQAYDRHSGLASDIGAYEYQYSDMIFSSAFDGCK
jgi:hypothetical protein